MLGSLEPGFAIPHITYRLWRHTIALRDLSRARLVLGSIIWQASVDFCRELCCKNRLRNCHIPVCCPVSSAALPWLLLASKQRQVNIIESWKSAIIQIGICHIVRFLQCVCVCIFIHLLCNLRNILHAFVLALCFFLSSTICLNLFPLCFWHRQSGDFSRLAYFVTSFQRLCVATVGHILLLALDTTKISALLLRALDFHVVLGRFCTDMLTFCCFLLLMWLRTSTLVCLRLQNHPITFILLRYLACPL
mmetsp:Transcript_52839/g.77389  ORF Transcript_52839/g.77389 Transcript_52839/m.77389 type:complete len:249 (-) Transcript_52839:629-1375(-)